MDVHIVVMLKVCGLIRKVNPISVIIQVSILLLKYVVCCGQKICFLLNLLFQTGDNICCGLAQLIFDLSHGVYILNVKQNKIKHTRHLRNLLIVEDNVVRNNTLIYAGY